MPTRKTARKTARPLDLESYLRVTRGVTVSIAYLLPLMAAYEVGVLWTGSDLRNSAELSLKIAAGLFGWLAPWIHRALLLGVLFVAVRIARRDEPAFRLFPFLLLEATLFALLLGPAAGAVVDGAGLQAAVAPAEQAATPTSTAQHVLLSIGAGVYEELVFRFLLLAGGFAFLQGLDVKRPVALAIAVAVSSLLFAGYHHFGAAGEPFTASAFVFRTAAGVALGLLFTWRGLALCAYLHAFYDILCDLAPWSQQS